jgi:hypothetical protein
MGPTFLAYVAPSCHMPKRMLDMLGVISSTLTLILWLTSLLMSPYLCTTNPKYQKVFFLGIN